MARRTLRGPAVMFGLCGFAADMHGAFLLEKRIHERRRRQQRLSLASHSKPSALFCFAHSTGISIPRLSASPVKSAG
jgi:hypothetical protein